MKDMSNGKLQVISLISTMKRGNIFLKNGLYDWSDAEIKHCEEIAVIKTRERLEQMKSRAKKVSR